MDVATGVSRIAALGGEMSAHMSSRRWIKADTFEEHSDNPVTTGS